MKRIREIVYRFLTTTDFFNMYKPPGTEAGGGGQLYIDFPTSSVPVRLWRHFFHNVRGSNESRGTRGPRWTVPVRSVGIQRDEIERLVVYQRRPQTICIGNQ